MAFSPSDFNKKVKFGSVEEVKNPHTGSTVKKFVPKVSLWFAPKTRTLNQQYKIIGTDLDNTRVIVIRHNPSVETYTRAQIAGVDYEITSYSPDESNHYISYDFVTLKRRS